MRALHSRSDPHPVIQDPLGGNMRPDSDIDLLVEFEPGQAPSLAGFGRLKNNLANLFGSAAIDLATPSILRNPYRRRAIVADLKELYAA